MTVTIEQIISSYKRLGIAKAAKELAIPYKELRTILNKNGIKIIRGRRRGSGVGYSINGVRKLDRRIKLQIEQIETGRCTGCGKPNDSDSLYHCKACLKK